MTDDEVEFLGRLREAGVPVSVMGAAEILVGQGVRAQLDAGVAREALACELASAVSVWSVPQALVVVDAASVLVPPGQTRT